MTRPHEYGESSFFRARPDQRARVKLRGEEGRQSAFIKSVCIFLDGDPYAEWDAEEEIAEHRGRLEASSEVSVVSAMTRHDLVDTFRVAHDRHDNSQLIGERLLSSLREFRTWTGDEIELPSEYLLGAGMAWDKRTAAVFAIFDDDELLPVCFGFAHEREDLEAVRRALSKSFLGRGRSIVT